MVFNDVSLVSDIEHLFTCLLAIYISSLEKWLSPLPIFELGILFFCCWVVRVLLIFWVLNICSNVIKFSVFLLVFCLDDLSIDDNGIWKSPTFIMLLSISPFEFLFLFCFILKQFVCVWNFGFSTWRIISANIILVLCSLDAFYFVLCLNCCG